MTDNTSEPVAVKQAFQTRVGQWAETCFPLSVVYDRLERRDRLVEEALELAQTLPDFTADRAHALVDYVFSRPVGVTEQESGGVSVTHAALCHAEGIDQQHWAEAELARISVPEVIEKIRAKQAAKPHGSALPVSRLTHSPAAVEALEEVARDMREAAEGLRELGDDLSADILAAQATKANRIAAAIRARPAVPDGAEKMREALEEIANPITAMQRRADADGFRLTGMAAQLSNDAEYLKGIARAALKEPTNDDAG